MDRVLLEGIEVIFGRTIALFDLSVNFPQGKATAVVGPNGAGKSTLLSLIAGRVRPGKGRLYRPEPVAAYLGHDLMLYEDFSGRENLEFFGRLWGCRCTSNMINDLLKRVGIQHAGDRPIRTYSRGMKQRLAIARLLLSSTDLWILDEPETGLDQEGRSWLAEVFDDALQNGKTIIFSSHFKEFVGHVAQRIIVLNQGKVAAVMENRNAQEAFALFGGET